MLSFYVCAVCSKFLVVIKYTVVKTIELKEFEFYSNLFEGDVRISTASSQDVTESFVVPHGRVNTVARVQARYTADTGARLI